MKKIEESRLYANPLCANLFGMAHKIAEKVSLPSYYYWECFRRVPDTSMIRDSMNNILEERYEDGWRSDEL